MRSNVPVHASIFILHYRSMESGIQWINKFLWSMEESRKALTSAIFTSTSCVCTPTPSLPIQSISRLFHLFYALHDAVLYLQPDTLFSLSRLSWWHVTLCHAKRTSGIVFCHLLATPWQVLWGRGKMVGDRRQEGEREKEGCGLGESSTRLNQSSLL